MEIETLKYFLKLAEVKKFIDAALDLDISQSSLSKKIQKLEYELGVHLFSRTSHTTQLTEEGRTFYPFAKTIVDQYEAALRALHKNTLRLGCMTVLAPYGIPKVVHHFLRDHPDVEMQVKEGRALEIIEDIDEYDFIIVRSILLPKSDSYRLKQLADDELCVVVSEQNPLSKFKSIDLRQLKDQPLIFPDPKTGGYEIYSRLCREAGFEPNILYTLPLTNSVFSFVEENAGVSFAFRRVFEEYERPHLKLIPLKDPVHCPVALVWRKNVRLNPLQEDFKNSLLQEMHQN